MSGLRNYFVMTILLFSLATCATAQPQEEILVEGVLSGVDTNENTLTINTSGGEEMRLKYTDELKIAGADENIQALSEKVGAPVKINYKVVDEQPEAIRVEIVAQ